jgi:hypothetical protein
LENQRFGKKANIMIIITGIVSILLMFSFSPESTHGFVTNSRLCKACTTATARHDVVLHASETSIDEERRLDHIAHQLKLEIYDLDDGVYGYATRDPHYGLEVLHSSIPTSKDGALGIELTEMAGASDGRGLVLISGISGAAIDSELQVGDTLTGVRGGNFHECLTGLNNDLTVEAITEAKAAAGEQGQQPFSFEVNRLVERARVSVEIVEGDGTAFLACILLNSGWPR